MPSPAQTLRMLLPNRAWSESKSFGASTHSSWISLFTLSSSHILHLQFQPFFSVIPPSASGPILGLAQGGGNAEVPTI